MQTSKGMIFAGKLMMILALLGYNYSYAQKELSIDLGVDTTVNIEKNTRYRLASIDDLRDHRYTREQILFGLNIKKDILSFNNVFRGLNISHSLSQSIRFENDTFYTEPGRKSRELSSLELSYIGSNGSLVMMDLFAKGTVAVEYSKFSEGLTIAGSKFESYLFFESDTIGKVAITGSNFGSGFVFDKCIFTDDFELRGGTFKRGIEIFNSKFNGACELGLDYYPKLWFQDTKFAITPDFSRTEVGDSLFFVGVEFASAAKDIYLDNVSLQGLRKRYGDSTRKCALFLYRTDFKKFVVNYDNFYLAFDKKVTIQEQISIYQQVIKKCNDVGLEESARGFDIDLKMLRIRSKYSNVSWVADIVIAFQRYWWNFGYEREKIILNTIYSFLVCFILVLVFFQNIVKTYFPQDFSGLGLRDSYRRNHRSRAKAILKISFFYTALLFFGWKLDHSKVQFQAHPLTASLIYIIYIVGLVHLAYLAGFVIVR